MRLTDAAQIILVEDHPLMRETVRDLLHEVPGLCVCATAGSAEEALQLAALDSADLILVDLSLPGLNGLELIRRLGRSHPGLRCLMVTSHKQPGYVQSALAAGARGYVEKGSMHELHEAVRSALAGDIFVSRSLRAGKPDAHPSMSTAPAAATATLPQQEARGRVAPQKPAC